MSSRTAAWLAWSPLAAMFGFLVAGFFLPPLVSGNLFFLPIAVAFATVGSLVASRRPANPIGWLLLAFGSVAAFNFFAGKYAFYALVTHPDSLPGAEWVAWVAVAIWHPGFGLFVFAFLLFPHGKLPSARWRLVAWFTAVTYAFGGIIGALWSPILNDFLPFVEPVLRLPGRGAAEVAFFIFAIANFLLLALAAISLLIRLRRAVGVEREQVKWLAYTVALMALVLPTSILLLGDYWVVGVLFIAVFSGMPVAIAIAILKYRLYEIDIIINRTLVYGSLTATLALVYFGGIVVLQRVFVVLTGEKSTLAVVASTLLIAALFSPLRRRVQGFVDRRFYRRKYDAAKTLAAFNARLREVTQLETLSGEVVGVVTETMQPAHVSMWLRPDTAPKGEQAD